MFIFEIAVALIVVLALGVIGFLYLASEKVAKLAMGSERARSGLTRKEIDLPDGLHYVYLEGGQGEPLMLLHGFGGDKDNFTRIARHLTKHYRVIAPDHIGFGESAHPQDADYTTRPQAARIRSLARALGITQMHLCGSSMGGHVAMVFTSLYPDEVKSLWLLNPGGVWSAPKGGMQTIIDATGEHPLLAKNNAEYARIFRYVMAKPPFIPRPILNVMAKEPVRNYNLYKRMFDDLSKDSVEKYVTGLKTPTLIVFGDKDRVFNIAVADILHELMPNSEVIIMPGLGHLPMVESPYKTAKDYLKFRARLQAASST